MGSMNSVHSVTCKAIDTVSRIRDKIGIVDGILSMWKSLILHWMEEAHGHHITCGAMWLQPSWHGLQWKNERRWMVHGIALKKHYRQ